MSELSIDGLVDWVLQGTDTFDLELARLQNEIDSGRLVKFFERIARYPNVVQSQEVDQRLTLVLANWLNAEILDNDTQPGDQAIEWLQEIYSLLANSSLGRGYILAWMARSGNGDAFSWFVDQIAENPPLDPNALSVAFAPLLTSQDWNHSVLFQKLFSSVSDSLSINLAIDVANHLFRKGHHPHPLTDYRVGLVEVLNSIVDRLEILQKSVPENAEVARSNAETVDESVAFITSIADALRLIGDRQTIGPLKRAMELEHRRIQCEAAVALAALKDPEGIKTLIALAEEPVVRKRVLSYAKELELDININPKFKTPAAIAESGFVEWLARQENFGVPPSECKLIDERLQYWPGFENAIPCMLFEFAYTAGENRFESVGIGAPCTFAFKSDLASLTADDCYQVFAGFDLEHDEVFLLEYSKATTRFRQEVDYLKQSFPADAKIQWLGLGTYLGDKILMGQIDKSDEMGFVAWDGRYLAHLELSGAAQPFQWQLFWYWCVGKRLFASFEQYHAGQGRP